MPSLWCGTKEMMQPFTAVLLCCHCAKNVPQPLEQRTWMTTAAAGMLVMMMTLLSGGTGAAGITAFRHLSSSFVIFRRSPRFCLCVCLRELRALCVCSVCAACLACAVPVRAACVRSMSRTQHQRRTDAPRRCPGRRIEQKAQLGAAAANLQICASS